MENSEIRDRLLLGSDNINLMTKKINSVVGILRSALRMMYATHEILDVTYESPTCRWKMFHITGENWKDVLSFSCYVDMQNEARPNFACGYATELMPPYSGNKIQKVFESLPFLIDSIRKEYPQVEYYWQFLIDASFVFEK